MRILHVFKLTDIRAFKQAVVMLDRGHQVELAMPFTEFYGFNVFTDTHLYTDTASLERLLQETRADVIHVHTDPNWLVGMVKGYAGDRPVIHDVHDPASLRTGLAPDQDELDAFGVADGIIHVSEGCRIHSEKMHGNAKPSIVIHSAVPKFYFNQDRHANFNAIVYQGGLTSKVKDEKGLHYFRNLLYVVEKFMAEGYSFSLFGAGSSEGMDDSYERLGAFVTNNLPYTTMLTGLRQYGFGFVGAPMRTGIIKHCMPNKLFEYISQGVIPVCWNADEAGEFVAERGIGIHIQGELKDLRRQLREGPKLRENLLKTRMQYSMEAQAAALEKFYQTFI